MSEEEFFAGITGSDSDLRLAVDPSLRLRLRYNPVEPLTEEEFPAQFR